MIPRAELKEQAREQMRGKFGALFVCFLLFWGIGIICTKGFNLVLIPGLFDIYKEMAGAIASASPDVVDDIFGNDVMRLSTYTNLANALSLAYWVLIYPMISVGIAQVLLNLTYGDVPQVSTVFEPYKTKFGKSIGTVWLKKIFEILWIIPFYIGWIVCIGIIIAVFVANDARMGKIMESVKSALELGNGFGDGMIMVIGLLFALILITFLIGAILVIPYSIIVSKYAMSIYIMNENPSLSSTQCIDESKRIMTGKRWDFFLLKLSFLPWFLLSLIPIAGWLSLIYTIPYMNVTVTDYYHQIKTTGTQEEVHYYNPGDVTDIIEDAADSIIGEGFEY
ncbi:MAG: DUF975 family protein [Lachnospiraceae bacterium]|nr:DUF975 family protein [Lachnospiraceae bacterium]